MSNRSLKKSPSGKSNRPVDLDADENLDLVNRGGANPLTSLDASLVKPGRRSFEQAKVAKPEADDEKKHENEYDPPYTPEVPLATLSKLVLEVRNASLKLQSISNTKAASKSESDISSKPTRSGSTIRVRPSNVPTFRSLSAPKKTTTASGSSPKRTVSRSLTLVSRKTPSRSSTPLKIISRTSTLTTPSFKKAGDTERSRSLTPKSKPLIAANSSAAAPPSTIPKVRSTSASSSRPSVSPTPQTPPRVKVTLAFGRPVTTTGTVNSPKRNISPDVTRTRPKGRSASPSLIPTFSGVSHTPTTPKSLKPSATPADSTRSPRKLSKPLDTRTGKADTNPFLSTMLYPPSVRSSSSAVRKRHGSEASSSSSSNQEEEEGKSLTKEGSSEKNGSARYDALLNVKDVKDTNWLLNIDDESQHSLIFDNSFDSPPEPFSPL